MNCRLQNLQINCFLNLGALGLAEAAAKQEATLVIDDEEEREISLLFEVELTIGTDEDDDEDGLPTECKS